MSPPDSLTILVHGFNKGSRDMRYLARGLFERGFSVLSVELPTTFGSLDQAVRALARQIDPAVARHRRIHFVAHSLGGLLDLPHGPGRQPQGQRVGPFGRSGQRLLRFGKSPCLLHQIHDANPMVQFLGVAVAAGMTEEWAAIGVLGLARAGQIPWGVSVAALFCGESWSASA